MPLSNLHVINVCKKNAKMLTCRYLSEDLINFGESQCLKLTGQKKYIDDAVEKHFASNDPELMPVGDNCKGYPVLHHIVAGYDCEKKSG